MEYAAVITLLTSNYKYIMQQKQILPKQLLERKLTINESKTENFVIKRCTCTRSCDCKWKTCKLLDTTRHRK